MRKLECVYVYVYVRVASVFVCVWLMQEPQALPTIGKTQQKGNQPTKQISQERIRQQQQQKKIILSINKINLISLECINILYDYTTSLKVAQNS